MPNYQPQGIAEGIYFNMDEDTYHGDPALSHSGMTKLLVSWPDYWVGSCHNPDRKKYQPTDAMKFGSRSGMYLLENKKFHEQYITYKTKGASSNGIYLSSIDAANIAESIEAIRSVPVGNKYFSNGYGEVSIFWRDPRTKIMLRVRIDYLRTFGSIDFKRILAVNPWAIGKAINNQGLDIQNWLYLEGIVAARLMLKRMLQKDLVAFAKREGVALDWLIAFRDDEDLMFRFVFQRSTPPWIWEVKDLEPAIVADGCKAATKAMDRFVLGISTYGTEKPVLGDGKVTTVSQYHVPRRDYD
jgi:hypothetical protein